MPKVPLAASLGEEKILASDFVAGLFPLAKPEDAKEIYEQFKKDHPKADHYPYAYCLNGTTKSSDDGEPGSSAGVPLASLLKEKDIDGMIVVARYFGGTKLGIPRLRRAFLSSATNAIENARLGEAKQRFVYALEVDYSVYETLKKFADRLSFSITETVFDIKVQLKVASGARLDGLGEKIGQYDLVLPSPSIETYIEEIRL